MTAISNWAREQFQRGDPLWALVPVSALEAAHPGTVLEVVVEVAQELLRALGSPNAMWAVEHVRGLHKTHTPGPDLLKRAEEVWNAEGRDEVRTAVSRLISAAGHRATGNQRVYRMELVAVLNILSRLVPPEVGVDRILVAFDRAVSEGSNWKVVKRLAEYAKDLVDGGHFDPALPVLSQAIGLSDKSPDAWNLRGIVWSRNYEREHAPTDFDRALSDFAMAISLQPKFAGALCNRGLLYYKAQDFERARVDLLRAVKIIPTHPKPWRTRARAWTNLGVLEEDRGNLAEGVLCHEKATKDAPDLVPAWSNLADALDHQRRYAEAEAAASKAIELDKGNKRLYPFLIRASARLGSGRLDDAIEDANRAIALNDHCAEAWNTRGAAYFRKGRRDLAKRDFVRASELAPNAPEVYANLAATNLAEGDAQGAERDAVKALGIDPTNAIALSVLARLGEHGVSPSEDPMPVAQLMRRESRRELVGAASSDDG